MSCDIFTRVQQVLSTRVVVSHNVMDPKSFVGSRYGVLN